MVFRILCDCLICKKKIQNFFLRIVLIFLLERIFIEMMSSDLCTDITDCEVYQTIYRSVICFEMKDSLETYVKIR